MTIHALSFEAMSGVHGGIPKLACQVGGAIIGGASDAYLSYKGRGGVLAKALINGQGAANVALDIGNSSPVLAGFDGAAAIASNVKGPIGAAGGLWTGLRAGATGGAAWCGYTE